VWPAVKVFEATLIRQPDFDLRLMRLLIEHKLPKKLRYAKVYLEAGPASMAFSLDGATADWHANMGKKKGVELTDVEYTRLRAKVPAVELLDDDGRKVLIRNAAGSEELWEKPRWMLTRTRKVVPRRD
jgi:hypothetical protein